MTTSTPVLATLTRTFTQDDIDAFGHVSGGTGHIHTDPDYAAATPFGRTLVQGLYLLAVMVRAVSGAAPGATEFTCRFVAPVCVGDAFRVEVREAAEEFGPLVVEATVDGRPVVVGTAAHPVADAERAGEV